MSGIEGKYAGHGCHRAPCWTLMCPCPRPQRLSVRRCCSMSVFICSRSSCFFIVFLRILTKLLCLVIPRSSFSSLYPFNPNYSLHFTSFQFLTHQTQSLFLSCCLCRVGTVKPFDYSLVPELMVASSWCARCLRFASPRTRYQQLWRMKGLFVVIFAVSLDLFSLHYIKK